MKIPNVGFHAEIFADIFHLYISVVVNIKFNKRTIETQKAKEVFENARQVRNDIQEKMRLAFLSCAQEFQAQGYIFSFN